MPRRLALALMACGGCAAAPPPRSTPAAAIVDAGAPEASVAERAPARATREPTAAEREASAGVAVFMRVCGPCHEAMWRVAPAGPLPRLRWTEAAMRRQIREGSRGDGGREGMPALGADALPERDLPALFAYLRQVEAIAPP